ncbi:MAG: sensor histidine kinase N-terminal domain-containing protein, partial [Pigmentiphaga sp.]|nr:sensor histidine kinase N-terminal domain-containing protein [Pigmentiphaga sp.]
MFPSNGRRRRNHRHPTLLGRILLWMIVPLFTLWSIGIVITYFISLNLANSPYDRTLASHLRLLRHEIELQHVQQGTLHISDAARNVLAGSHEEEPTRWLILDANGQRLAGDSTIPVPDDWGYDIDQVRFRNATLGHQALRIAYVWGGRDLDGTGFLAVVAEPAEPRATLQQEILTGMLTPQLIILPLAAMLAGLGLTQGLEPLSILQEHMRRRKPSDLSPIRDDLAPAEIVPLIAAMNNLLRRLADSIDSQRRFVANAAHQLKTPLAGIRTQCEVALREKDPEHMRISLQQLIMGSDRATRLVNQLLLLARAESHQPGMEPVQAPVDLRPLAEQCILDWLPTALQRQIDLGFEGADEPLPVFGNALMIRELLNNLIDNALLYTPAGGRVTVRALADGHQVCLEVQDNGPGIPPAERERVFDRFYRILGQEAEGSGLGLAIVREIT